MTNQIRFLIDCLIEQMALMLMNDYNMSITDALDTVFIRHEMKYGKLV